MTFEMIIALALGRLEPPTSPLWEARSNLLSYSAIISSFQDRWGRDSNPRGDLSPDSLAVSWFRPLIHLTKTVIIPYIVNWIWISRKKHYIEFWISFFIFLGGIMSEVAMGVEDLWNVRSDVNQVWEEAVQHVQAQSKQAQHIAQQIKKDKAINYHLAQFLSFLMKKIQDEEFIKAIIATFFKTTNPKNQVTYLRRDINTYVVVGFFLPFFLKEAGSVKILPLYAGLNYQEASSSLKAYITYLGQLSEHYHDNVPIDQNALVHLIVLIAQEWLNKDKNWNEEVLTNEIKSLLF